MKSYSIELHGKILHDIDDYAKKRGITREDAVRIAFGLLSILNRKKRENNILGIIEEDRQQKCCKMIARIKGV